jgi:hypothetical protein
MLAKVLGIRVRFWNNDALDRERSKDEKTSTLCNHLLINSWANSILLSLITVHLNHFPVIDKENNEKPDSTSDLSKFI